MSPSPSPQRASVAATARTFPSTSKAVVALPQLNLSSAAAAAPVLPSPSAAQSARHPPLSNDHQRHHHHGKSASTLLFRSAEVPPKSSPRNHFYRINAYGSGQRMLGGGDVSDAISISSTISCVSGTSPKRRQQHQLTMELDEDRAAVLALGHHQTTHSNGQSPPLLSLDQPRRVSPNAAAGGVVASRATSGGSVLPSITKDRNTLNIPAPPGAATRRSPREVQLSLPSIFASPHSTSSNITALSGGGNGAPHDPNANTIGSTQGGGRDHSSGSGSAFVDSDSDNDNDVASSQQRPPRSHTAASMATSASSSIGERRLSRISEGQLHATKKATARVLKMMSSITISKSSRMIAAFRSYDQNLVARYLFKHCRLAKQQLNKEEFYVLVRSVMSDVVNAACGGVDPDDPQQALKGATSRRHSHSSAGTTSTNVTVVSYQRRMSFGKPADAPSNDDDDKPLPTQAQQKKQLLRREDADPIFTLLDEEELGVLDSRLVRNRFFTVALASPSDILARVIRLVFSSSAYYILESTISRFELQMMSDLLHEELLGVPAHAVSMTDNVAVPHELLEVIHRRDREALIAHETARAEVRRAEKQEASNQGRPQAALQPDDEEDDDDICLRLRDAVYEPTERRKHRLLTMLAVIREMPNLLNQAPRGCVTVRHLRSMCAERRFHISEEVDVVPNQENGWIRRRETVVVQKLRYDESFNTLALYLALSPPPPSHLAMASSSVPSLVSRTAALATAAASFLSNSFDLAANGGQKKADTSSSSSGQQQAHQRQYEEGEDPILAEAVEDYQIIQDFSARRQRSDSMIALPHRPPPITVTAASTSNHNASSASLIGAASRLAANVQRKQPQQENGSPAGMSGNHLATFDRMSMMSSLISADPGTTPRRGRNEQLVAMASQADLYRRLSGSGSSSTTRVPKEPLDLGAGLEHNTADSFTASPTSPMLTVQPGGSSSAINASPVSVLDHFVPTSNPSSPQQQRGATTGPKVPPQRRTSISTRRVVSLGKSSSGKSSSTGAATSTTIPESTATSLLLVPRPNSQYIDEHQYSIDFPAEHGNPHYASRDGVVYKHSDRCPQGRPITHDIWV